MKDRKRLEHRSLASTEKIRTSRPKIILISYGLRNMYNNPNILVNLIKVNNNLQLNRFKFDEISTKL